MANPLTLSKQVKFWSDQIETYERASDKWTKRSKKILKRYKDIRGAREELASRFNVLWANVQTRLPALYARDPKPEVERRFKDKDPIGRKASELLERALEYTISHCNPFGRIMRQAILDFELSGRGVVWVRYLPHWHKIAPDGASQISNNAGDAGEQITDDQGDPQEKLAYEETKLDYVYWEDFGYTWARTWEEVRACWRRVYLTREEGRERFGQIFDSVPLDWSPRNAANDAKISLDQKKAIIYEIWDKEKRAVIWVCKNFAEVLDERDDPFKLSEFFPTPAPLMANLAGDEYIPTPNFVFYQDQANEIDELSTRIISIGKALKVAGVRDASAAGLDRLLSEGTENALVPVDGWMALKEKGGLQGVMELLPIKDIAETLGYLRDQRQSLIDDVYQITGLSDIIRGLSEPNETATAQQIKGQFAVLRISDAQSEVQRYCRDLLRIMAEIIADYDIETLKQISGIKLLTESERAQLQMLAMPGMGGQPGAAPMPGGAPPGAGGAGAPAAMGGPAPPAGGSTPGAAGAPAGRSPAAGEQPASAVPQEKLQLLREPTWEQVAQVLENPVLREFRIDIETDSTIRTDEDADRAARMEFIDAVGKMVQQAQAVPHSMIPAVGELILFGIRGFRVARGLERIFEDAIDQLAQAPPPPDPEMQKAQIQAQTQIQIAQQKAQLDAQIAQNQQQAQAIEDRIRTEAEAQRSLAEQQAKAAHEQQIKQLENQFESERVQFESASKERIAQADNQTKLQIAHIQHQHELQLEQVKQDHEKTMGAMQQSHEEKIKGAEMQHAASLESAKQSHEKQLEQHKGEISIQNTDRQNATKEKIASEPREAEKEKAKPTLAAIEKLTQALQEARKPRKIVRGDKGEIVGIH